MNNILYILNHKTLTDFEVPLLINKGYGVLINKTYKSLAIDNSLYDEDKNYYYDNFINLDYNIIYRMNNIDWFNNSQNLSDNIIDLLNKHFKFIFITLLTNGNLLQQLKRQFKGLIFYRFFGMEKNLLYETVLKKNTFSNNIKYIFSYQEIFTFESDFFNITNSYVIPLGLSNTFISKYNNCYNPNNNNICFICSKIGRCQYYTNIYKEFIKNFKNYEYVILGKNNNVELNIINNLSDKEYYLKISECKVMYYHGIEPRHLHFHPLEAMIIGIPIIFHSNSLLSKYLNNSPGKCESIEEAKLKIDKILHNDTEFIQSIISVQNNQINIITQNTNYNVFENLLNGIQDIQLNKLPKPSKKRLVERWSNLNHSYLTELKCYICDYNDNINKYTSLKCKDIFEAGELIRYQCPRCKVIFGDLRFLSLSPSQIAADYTDLYSFYSEGDTYKYILQTLVDTKVLENKNKSILDFACGDNNRIIPYLMSLGHNILGYDKYVNNNSYVLKDLKGLKFDIIYSSNYIEHLINPIEELNNLLNYLNDDGKLIFISPCFEYCYTQTHYHTFFFVEDSINYLCKKLNIKITFSKKIIFDDNEFTTVKIFEKNV